MDDNVYTAEDFIADEHFQEWVRRPTPESDAYWENWLLEHPGNAKAAEEARLFIRLVQFRTYEPAPSDQADVWAGIRAAEAKTVRLNSWRTVSRVAAAVVLLLTAAGGWYWFRQQPPSVSTGYAQTRTVTLPDGSTVQLNANSTLRYARAWAEGRNREVWLEGEAFFSVQKRKAAGGPVKFTVHAGELDVEVIGTRFDVNTRREATRVVLSEGKVRLRSPDNRELTMQPGELAGFSPQAGQFTKRRVNPAEYSAWRENKVIFNEATLEEVARGLEDYFGYQVFFADPALKGKTFRGTFPADTPEVWLSTLSRSFPMHVDENAKKVVFGADAGAAQ